MSLFLVVTKDRWIIVTVKDSRVYPNEIYLLVEEMKKEIVLTGKGDILYTPGTEVTWKHKEKYHIGNIYGYYENNQYGIKISDQEYVRKSHDQLYLLNYNPSNF